MRVDLYREIHKGLRYELCNRLTELGALDLGDDAAVRAFADAFTATSSRLVEHAGHEEKWVHPLLADQYDELLAELETEHGEVEQKMETAKRGIDALSGASAEERPAMGANAYLVLADFVGAYLVHMGREEREAMAALWGLYDDGRLMGVTMQIRGSIAPPRMAEFLSSMIPAMNLDERSAMLQGMRDHAPPEAFAGVCGLAESVLPAADWSAVKTRVGI